VTDAPAGFQIETWGSTTLVRPMTDAARTWLEARAALGPRWIGGALSIEPQFALDFADYLRLQGFVVDTRPPERT
jgi:hypothetical protein